MGAVSSQTVVDLIKAANIQQVQTVQAAPSLVTPILPVNTQTTEVVAPTTNSVTLDPSAVAGANSGLIIAAVGAGALWYFASKKKKRKLAGLGGGYALPIAGAALVLLLMANKKPATQSTVTN